MLHKLHKLSLTTLVVRSACAGILLTTGGPVLANELQIERPVAGGSRINLELPKRTSFPELATPQIDVDLLPEAILPPPANEADTKPADAEPKPAVAVQPPVEENVTASPDVVVPVPASKPKAPALPMKTIKLPAATGGSDLTSPTTIEIPVVGIELTPKQDQQPVTQQPAIGGSDRR